MPDRRFFTTGAPISLGRAAEIASARMHEDSSQGVTISHADSIEQADLSGAVVFMGDERFLDGLAGKNPAACLIPEKLVEAVIEKGLHKTSGVVICANPRASFARLAASLHASIAEQIDPPDLGEPQIDQTAIIGANVVIGPGAIIGANTQIGANSVIGAGTVIGDDCYIGGNVTISHSIIGDRARFLSGARIGEAGFGFVMDGGRQLRVPQLGRVVIGDDVEIGANTTIDRGALKDTIIDDFTKIDNLVQIGHNVVIGKGCAIAAMCGISGSCVIGDGALLGGQVGVGDHVTIGKGAIIYACAALMKDVPDGEVWGGYPAKKARQWLKEVAAVSRLLNKKNAG